MFVEPVIKTYVLSNMITAADAAITAINDLKILSPVSLIMLICLN